MKTWLAGGLAALLLLTCVQAAGGRKLPGGTGSVLTVTLEDCEDISIRETSTKELSFSGSASGYQTTLEPATVTIRQRAEEDNASPVLEVPAGRYDRIRVQATDSVVTVQPDRADYALDVKDGMCDLRLHPTYTGAVSANASDNSFTVTMLGREPENLRLSATLTDCTMEAPAAWGWKDWEDSYAKTWGAGTGSLTVTARDCLISMDRDLAGDSRYRDLGGAAFAVGGKSGEAIFADPNDSKSWIYSGTGDDPFADRRAQSVPNTVTPLKTIPAGDIRFLQANVRLCGVAIEPSETGAFELTYVGVPDPAKISVETSSADGVLTVTCTGKPEGGIYVNTSPDFRVATVRIGVPAGVLEELRLDCGTGNLLINGVDVAVRGVETNGLTRVTGGTMTAPVDLRCSNGSLTVQGDTVTSSVTLAAANGSVSLTAGQASGPVDLSARNGSVYVQADRLETADLLARNGSVRAEVGAVGSRVLAQVSNGSLRFHLTRQPQDLTFRLSGGWRDRDNALPGGWRDGYTVGNGKPVLELSASSNGSLDFSVGGAG